MANFKRADRVADLIQAEIADILHKEIKDPRIGSLTVTDVTISDDLRVAKVYFVEMAQDICNEEIQEGLERAKGFIRKELGRRLRLRYTPEVIFRPDNSFAYGSRIDRILAELKKQDSNDA
ncbi:MAG: 30S ribosome-binding factor RbfA [Syntrophobacterales bacterium]|jgi:ribosome-binding factor A|nr:30S ribosome-binding factor RbfA [Syntrophobacterales bacterium]